MSLRTRRAAAPVSSSASTPTLPHTMCIHHANRNNDETSALRQQAFVIVVFASSALTCAVIAMDTYLPRFRRSRDPLLSESNDATLCCVLRLRLIESMHYIFKYGRQSQRIVTGTAVGHRHLDDHQLGRQVRRRLLQARDIADSRRICDDGIDRQLRGVCGQDLEVRLRFETVCLARLCGEVENHDASSRGLMQGIEDARYEQVRDHTGEPRSRADDDPARVVDRGDGFWTCGRIGRIQPHGDDLRFGRGDLHLAPDPVERSLAVELASYESLDVQRYRAHGQHAALCAEEPSNQVEPTDVVTEQLPQRHDQQVADGVVVQVASAFEPVLQHVGPRTPPFVVATQGRQRHPQVTRREYPELVPQACRRAPGVCAGRDGGEVRRAPAQRRETRGEPVPAPERDHRRKLARAYQRATLERSRSHSRPRSRWTVMTRMSSPRNRSANASDMATLRCFPPVQPIAMLRNRLPSRTNPRATPFSNAS